MSDHPRDPLDDRLQAWAEAAEQDAPDLALPHRVPTHRRAFAALAVAASVAALVVGITVVVSREGAPVVAPPVVATTTPTDTGRSTVERSPSADPTPPVATQAVTYKGLQVEVPASWRIDAIQCSSALEDTVIFPQLFLACDFGPHPEGLTVVQFFDGAVEPDFLRGPGGTPSPVPGDRVLNSVRFDGRIEEAEGLEVTRVVVAELGVSVEIKSADRGAVDTILATLRYVDVDAQGCQTSNPMMVTALPKAFDPTALLSPNPDRVVLCRYGDGLLHRSVTLDDDQTARLSDLLTSLGPSTAISADCSEAAPLITPGSGGVTSIRIQADARAAAVVLTGCELYIMDEQGSSVISPEIFEFLGSTVGFDGGFSPLLIPDTPDPSAVPTS